MVSDSKQQSNKEWRSNTYTRRYKTYMEICPRISTTIWLNAVYIYTYMFIYYALYTTTDH